MTLTDNYSQKSTYRSRDLSIDGAGSPTQTRTVEPTRTRRVPFRQPRRKFQRTPGSQQVFSYRGRRVTQEKADPRTVRLVILATLALVGGIFASMWISGITTTQTFELQNLQRQETTLRNQVETLNRDVESVSSSAELARRATELGMVIPDQPGILATDELGNTFEQRATSDITRPIVDINGQQVKATSASSDPVKTNEVTDTLNAVPNTSFNSSTGAVTAPYAVSDSNE
ncbi:putative secreted protein [Corynebacterium kutscheri]|uniref:Secreted protein n=1 Tax=Corynebacterium kutscheri TaxID=35755 RepID=A0A0F6R078_9CORY|nr:hypothetical protein [Corynebacterium kutscheri]AKE41567.1 hypothetical protein UL82_07010 [Corynebacterium kutscheri]VEH08846.1 putative secreted protein [Corynebacterium kutscheri]VEH09891.1 putative secreted protein [Corynebacterium kutscheri]VEH79975.1 putative secreted protein [Corynebacterium kutscheri]